MQTFSPLIPFQLLIARVSNRRHPLCGHYAHLRSLCLGLLLILIMGFVGLLSARLPQAVAEPLTKTEIQVLPRQKHRPLNHIYAFDGRPLGPRIPLVLVPGRAEEFQHKSWWKKMRHWVESYPPVDAQYKLYVYLYDSKDELETQVQGFQTDLHRLMVDIPTADRPMVWISYSLGGLIAREAMEDSTIAERVHTNIAIGVPFHGTPIFDPHWFGAYFRHVSPLRQAWDRVIYRAYLWNKSNLIRGMRWNNFDCSSPQFETPKIKGDVLVAEDIPTYQERSTTARFKSKTVVYASFLENQYTKPAQDEQTRRVKRLIVHSRSLPKAIVGSLLPFYGVTTHDVFTYMNDQMGNLPSYSPDHPEGKNTHAYRYNDGAIPLSSALYLPARCNPYDNDLVDLIDQIDVRQARIFVNIDHVDLGHYRLGFRLGRIEALDILHPEDGRRTPNEWLLVDLEALAKDLPPATPTHP